MNKKDSKYKLTLDHQTVVRLKKKDTFRESYTEIESRLLDQLADNLYKKWSETIN
jgi:hypothetical protein